MSLGDRAIEQYDDLVGQLRAVRAALVEDTEDVLAQGEFVGTHNRVDRTRGLRRLKARVNEGAAAVVGLEGASIE